eukprot:2324491-Alexandrium_andersonii.AAC.1
MCIRDRDTQVDTESEGDSTRSCGLLENNIPARILKATPSSSTPRSSVSYTHLRAHETSAHL